MKLSIRRPIQFVATDVDGTFVGPDKTVSPAAKEAINRAIERGLKGSSDGPENWRLPLS